MRHLVCTILLQVLNELNLRSDTFVACFILDRGVAGPAVLAESSLRVGAYRDVQEDSLDSGLAQRQGSCWYKQRTGQVYDRGVVVLLLRLVCRGVG